MKLQQKPTTRNSEIALGGFGDFGPPNATWPASKFSSSNHNPPHPQYDLMHPKVVHVCIGGISMIRGVGRFSLGLKMRKKG